MENKTDNKLTKTEIKIILYKEKPTAKKVLTGMQNEEVYMMSYSAKSSIGEHIFMIPVSEMGETPFESELPAQLLIRWLV